MIINFKTLDSDVVRDFLANILVVSNDVSNPASNSLMIILHWIR